MLGSMKRGISDTTPLSSMYGLQTRQRPFFPSDIFQHLKQNQCRLTPRLRILNLTLSLGLASDQSVKRFRYTYIICSPNFYELRLAREVIESGIHYYGEHQ